MDRRAGEPVAATAPAEQLQRQETSLREQLRRAAQMHQQYRRELQLARANRSAERLLGNLGQQTRGLQAHMGDLASSLERIRHRQDNASDVGAALQQLQDEDDGSALDQRLQRAGIATGKTDANSVLARLRGNTSASE